MIHRFFWQKRVRIHPGVGKVF
ncbi:hypothetical protein LINPERPRIM_LOCUS2095 [Linum perenne]